RAEGAKPVGRTGRPKKGEESTPLPKGAHSDRLTARIAKHRPDVLERMKAGEFRSVRGAAIAAGIVKGPTPLGVSQRVQSVPVGWPHVGYPVDKDAQRRRSQDQQDGDNHLVSPARPFRLGTVQHRLPRLLDRAALVLTRYRLLAGAAVE